MRLKLSHTLFYLVKNMSFKLEVYDKSPYRYFNGKEPGGKGVYGHIFGLPFRFNPRCDPNMRVYQKTLLKHHTLVTLVPGVPASNSSKLADAKKIVSAAYGPIMQKAAQMESSSGANAMALQHDINTMVRETLTKLTKSGCDMRYLTFKRDARAFWSDYNRILNRVAVAIFGESKFALSGSVLSKLDERSGGFKFWAEKSTSISEDLNNSYQASVFSQLQKSASNIVKQLRFAGSNFVSINAAGETTRVESADASAADTGTLTMLASNTLGGNLFQFPDVYDSSEFSRNYNISFKFISPQGDDRSIFFAVIAPFLFLASFAMPRQDGPSGAMSNYICQLDAPGYFSCTMGVVTSLSFTKGGDEKMFNANGLPLCIEGNLTVRDLYSNLTLPQDYVELGVNFGTAAFLDNLGGLRIYDSLDMSILRKGSNLMQNIKSQALKPMFDIIDVAEDWGRYFGVIGGNSSIWDSIQNLWDNKGN